MRGLQTPRILNPQFMTVLTSAQEGGSREGLGGCYLPFQGKTGTSLVHREETAYPGEEIRPMENGPHRWQIVGLNWAPRLSAQRKGRKENDKRAGLLIFAAPQRWGAPQLCLQSLRNAEAHVPMGL